MLEPDFRDMLSALSAAGAEYLVIGAYAMAVQGFPRGTGDLDIWIRPDPENAHRVREALMRYGAPVADLESEELARPGLIFQIGVAPLRIDIVTEITGVAFTEAWVEREEREMGGLRVPVISKRHLLVNKRAVGRPKDLIDAAWLEENGG